MATMGATELGLVTLMYFSEQGYKSGFSAFAIGVISLLGFVFVGKTGFIIKGLRDLRMHTIAEFFGCATAAARRSSRRSLRLRPA